MSNNTPFNHYLDSLSEDALADLYAALLRLGKEHEPGKFVFDEMATQVWDAGERNCGTEEFINRMFAIDK